MFLELISSNSKQICDTCDTFLKDTCHTFSTVIKMGVWHMSHLWLYHKIHLFFVRNSCPINGRKTHLGIHSVMWWNFHLLSYEKTHTEYHPFLCLKKGRKNFIPNSSIPNSYLYSQKSHFHELNGWKTCPKGPTVVAINVFFSLEIFSEGSGSGPAKIGPALRARAKGQQKWVGPWTV